jgi:predicted GIY-YIG superfamily endonuclease
MTYIYLVEKCYGDVNKVYIGKSVNPQSRKNQHLKKYGRKKICQENDRFEILPKEKINVVR